MQGPKPFGGYVRVSRIGERDDRLRSPEFQRTAVEAKATAAGVTVAMFAPELDVSGSKRERAILDSIVERIESGELAGIIVYNLSRLSRLKPRDRIELVERIEAAGGTILSASESFDTSTPEGRFQRDLFFSLARMQWEQAADGFAVAKANAIANGRPVKNVIPFGYRQASRGAELTVDRDEAAIVVELFELRASGASFGEILAHFERATGRSSHRSSVRYLLENRVYLGELRYGREVELVNVDGAPAIVSLELFEAAQAINAERSRAHGYNAGGKAKSLLAGIAKCGGCGRGLVCTKTGSRRIYSYKCPADARHCSTRAHIQAEPLEAHVIERVLEWAGPAADELVELEVELGAHGDRIVAEHRLEEAEASLLRFVGDLELEDSDPTAYAAGVDARRQRVELRRGELAACGEASELELVRGTIREALLGEELEVADRRALLAVALSAVVVRRAPGRSTPIGERVEVALAATASGTREHAPELGEQARA